MFTNSISPSPFLLCANQNEKQIDDQLEQIAHTIENDTYTPNETLWLALEKALESPRQLPIVVKILRSLLQKNELQIPLHIVLYCLEKIAEYPLTDPMIDELFTLGSEPSLHAFLQNHHESAAQIRAAYENLIQQCAYRCKHALILNLQHQADSLLKGYEEKEKVSSVWNKAVHEFLEIAPPAEISNEQKGHFFEIQHAFAYKLLENEIASKKTSGETRVEAPTFSLAIKKMITNKKYKNHFITGLKGMELIQPDKELISKFLSMLQWSLKEFKNNAGISKRIFRFLLKFNINVKELVTLNTKLIDHTAKIALEALRKSVNKDTPLKIKLPQLLLQMYEKLELKEPPSHLQKLGGYIMENKLSEDSRWLFSEKPLQVKVIEDAAKETIELQPLSSPDNPEEELKKKIQFLHEVKENKREGSFNYCLKKLQELEKKGLATPIRNSLLCLLMEKSFECKSGLEGEILRKISEKLDAVSTKKLFEILNHHTFSESLTLTLLPRTPNEQTNLEKLLFLFIENKKNHQDLSSEKWKEIYFAHLSQASYKKLQDSHLVLWSLQNHQHPLANSLLLHFIGEKIGKTAAEQAVVHDCLKKYLLSQKKPISGDLLSNLNTLFLIFESKPDYHSLIKNIFTNLITNIHIETIDKSDIRKTLVSAPFTELKASILIEYLLKMEENDFSKSMSVLLMDIVSVLADTRDAVKAIEAETLNKLISFLPERFLFIENFQEQDAKTLENFTKRMRALFDVIWKIMETDNFVNSSNPVCLLYFVLVYINYYTKTFPNQPQFSKDMKFIKQNGQEITYRQAVYRILEKSQAPLVETYKSTLQPWLTTDQINKLYQQRR